MLTLEQFKALRDQGLSTSHIIDSEKAPAQDIGEPEEAGFIQSFTQDIAQPFLKAGVTLAQPAVLAGKMIGGKKFVQALTETQTEPTSFGYLGKATPLQSPSQLLGTGAELSSYLPFSAAGKIGVGAGKLLMKGGKGIPAIKKATEISKTAIPGAIGGSLAIGGRAAAEDKTPEEIFKQSVIGGTFGAVTAPVLSAGIGYIARKLEKPTISEAVHRYRDAFNIHQADYRKIEVKAGKDMDDVLQFSLEEGVVPSKLGGKIQTEESVRMLRDKKRDIDTNIADVLDNTTPKHDLEEMRLSAKKSIAKTAQNADELNQMNRYIDDLIDAEIGRYGRALVTDSELHTIKNGLWGIGFDINNRLKSPVGRRLGFFAKEMIQDSNPELNIQRMNQLSGMYQNSIDLLEGMHGRVVVGGRLGNWLAQGIGSFITDRLLGPIPYVGRFAAFLGNYVGKNYNEFVHDPTRIARDAVAMARKAKLGKRSNEIIDQFERNIPKLKGRQFMEEFQRQTPSSKNLLPPGQTTPPQYMGRGEYIPGQPSTPSQAVIPTQTQGILEGQAKLRTPVNQSFQESSGVLPVYPPVRSENRMLGPGDPNQSYLNQGRAIQVLPQGSREYVGKDVSIGKYSAPKKKEIGRFRGVGSASATQDLSGYFSGSKGLSAEDIMAKYPDIQLKREVPVTDIKGDKGYIPAGEVLTPYELKGNKVLLKDGQTYVVSKNQYQNIKGNAVSSEAKTFAPELAGTEESVRGASKWQGDELYDNGNRLADVYEGEKGKWHYRSDMVEESPAFKTRKEAMENAEADALGIYSGNETKYSQYQLPEGKNYKEILIKAPQGEGSGLTRQQALDKIKKKNGSEFVNITEEEVQGMMNKNGIAPFKSSHWDEPNVISHLRLNERTYKGKKVTFMEELQSDFSREFRNQQKGNMAIIDSNWEGLLKKMSDDGILTVVC